MLSYWFSAIAAVAWFSVALIQVGRGDGDAALLAALAGLSFAAAFGLRLRERRPKD